MDENYYSDKPFLTLYIHGRPFQGLIDIGVDLSVIALKDWPSQWPLRSTTTPIKGVGNTSAPKISSNHLPWQTSEGHHGTFQPFILDIDLYLWDRDILADMGPVLETPPIPKELQSPIVIQMMHKMGYETGKGLGKTLQGPIEPLSITPKTDRHGVGFQKGH